MKVIDGEYRGTEGSAFATGLPFDRDCSDDDCFAPAGSYWLIYNHNELASPPCGFRRSVMLLVPYCDQHHMAIVDREMGRYDSGFRRGPHSQCMGENVRFTSVGDLFSGEALSRG